MARRDSQQSELDTLLTGTSTRAVNSILGYDSGLRKIEFMGTSVKEVIMGINSFATAKLCCPRNHVTCCGLLVSMVQGTLKGADNRVPTCTGRSCVRHPKGTHLLEPM